MLLGVVFVFWRGRGGTEVWDEDVTGWVFIHRGSWRISVCKFSVAIPSRTVLICAREQYIQSEPLLSLFALESNNPCF